MNSKLPKSFQKNTKPLKFITSFTPVKIQNHELSTNNSSSKKSIGNSHSTLPKPDFSPIIKNEENIAIKFCNSYKKEKIIFPETPIKNPNQKYFTPIAKIVSKKLFAETNENNNNIYLTTSTVFRKLNFDINENNKEQSQTNVQIKIDVPKELPKKKSENYEFLKNISKGKFGIVYKCKSIIDNNVYAIKKSIHSTNISEYYKITQIINDFKPKSEKDLIFSQFINEYRDCWLEEEISDRSMFIQMSYCENGDLLNYLSKLEESHYIFSSSFFWNIIFEMLCGVFYIHSMGYLHLDIKPANFIVDSNGKVRLTDFGLSQKKEDIHNLNDITEGDVSYLSPEVFNQNNFELIDEKSDVFSLGMSILEILFKMQLPKNGKLWREMREDTFDVGSLFENCQDTYKSKECFIHLIRFMVTGYQKRLTIMEIFNDDRFFEIKIRYNSLLKGEYHGNGNIISNDVDEVLKFSEDSNSNCTPRNNRKTIEYY